MKDYKGFVEGKYPDPEDRKAVQDFPPVSSLFTYGVDFPMPESRGDLRCTYNDKEPIPPLKLEDLRGFKVPPGGIVTVTANGMGLKAGWAGIVYGAGTFRKGESGINMTYGAEHKDMMIARTKVRKDAYTDGLIEEIEELGIAVFDNTKDKEPQVVKALGKLVLRLGEASGNTKEILNLLKHYWEKMAHQEEVLDSLGIKEVAKFGTASFDAMDKALEIIREEREKLEAYESVDVSVTDIDD